MSRTDYRKRSIIGIVFMVIGVLIHWILLKNNIPAEVYLPLQVPLFIAAFLMPPFLAALFGALTPLVNTLLLGQPIFLYDGIIMIVEYAVYAAMISVLYRKVKLPSIISLLFSMIIGRIASVLTVFVLALLFFYRADPVNLIIDRTIAGLPGVIIQLIIVPVALYGLLKYTTMDLD